MHRRLEARTGVADVSGGWSMVCRYAPHVSHFLCGLTDPSKTELIEQLLHKHVFLCRPVHPGNASNARFDCGICQTIEHELLHLPAQRAATHQPGIDLPS